MAFLTQQLMVYHFMHHIPMEATYRENLEGLERTLLSFSVRTNQKTVAPKQEFYMFWRVHKDGNFGSKSGNRGSDYGNGWSNHGLFDGSESPWDNFYTIM